LIILPIIIDMSKCNTIDTEAVEAFHRIAASSSTPANLSAKIDATALSADIDATIAVDVIIDIHSIFELNIARDVYLSFEKYYGRVGACRVLAF
jgi:hypothetical protein